MVPARLWGERHGGGSRAASMRARGRGQLRRGGGGFQGNRTRRPRFSARGGEVEGADGGGRPGALMAVGEVHRRAWGAEGEEAARGIAGARSCCGRPRYVLKV
jgi:hypothetical protein